MPRIASAPIALLAVFTIVTGCATRLASEADPSDGGAVDTAAIGISPDGASEMTGAPGGDADDASPGDSRAGSDEPDAGVPSQPKLPGPVLRTVGFACSQNSECQTGYCVDGVCCGAAACGTCYSCAVAGSLGTCSPIPKDTEDPQHECSGLLACDGNGHCAQYDGNPCSNAAECISGFCVDGNCCDSACDKECYSCSTIQYRGQCAALSSGWDTSGAATCSGTRSCAQPPGSPEPLCLASDGQACATSADCASGTCSTFFADADGDRYGNSSRLITVCGPSSKPPKGYSATPGDCCDADEDTHPGQTSWFGISNACGSWDYNCNGSSDKQFAEGPCSGSQNPAECGKPCVTVILGSPVTRYTQACR